MKSLDRQKIEQAAFFMTGRSSEFFIKQKWQTFACSSSSSMRIWCFAKFNIVVFHYQNKALINRENNHKINQWWKVESSIWFLRKIQGNKFSWCLCLKMWLNLNSTKFFHGPWCDSTYISASCAWYLFNDPKFPWNSKQSAIWIHILTCFL